MKRSFILLTLLAGSVLQGCSSVVQNTLYHPDFFQLELSGATDEEIQKFHNLEQKNTVLYEGLDLAYLWGDATNLTEEFNPMTLKFKMHHKNAPPDVEAVRNYSYEGKYRNSPVADAKGLVILLHSYGADAESVYFDSTALQLKGYNTVVIDLMGHGNNSSVKASFGPEDIKRLNSLIEELTESAERPLLFYGKSYGASIAAQYAERYDNVDGLILIAPMTHFTQAATIASRAINPILKTLISEKWLTQEVEQTLTASAVSSEQISTPNVLKRIPNATLPPTLVLFSEVDKISQHSDIATLKDLEKVTLVSIPKRRHIEMMIFDDTVDKHLNDWLRTFEQQLP